MIALRGVSVDYGAGNIPLCDLSFDLPSGAVAIMGPSGSGKSTLLRLIAGVQVPTSGSIEIDSVPVMAATWRSMGDSRVAMVHQDYRLVPFLSVGENLLLAAELRGLKAGRQDVLDLLGKLGLELCLLDRRPLTLSGGQQQRVAIARALICRVSILLADEPTGALDSDNTKLVADTLVDVSSEHGVSVVVATHDDTVASRFQHRYVLQDGLMREHTVD